MDSNCDDAVVPVPVEVLEALLGDGIERIVAVHMARALLKPKASEGVRDE